MYRVIIVENDRVINVVDADEATWPPIQALFQAAYPTWEFIPESDLPKGVGMFSYRVNGVWFNQDDQQLPIPEPEPEEPPVEPEGN